MALAWMTLLKTVPWTDVIATAPAVADGAKKLWTAVSRSAGRDAGPAPAAPATPAADPAEALAALQQRVQALEEALATQATESHTQLQACAALIEQLAAQNSELVQRVEAHRVRLRWLSAAVIVSGVLALGATAALWFARRS